MKKNVFILILLAMATFVNADLTSTNFWNNATGDGKWSTPGNWTDGVAPNASSFGGVGIVSDLCVIDTTISAKGLELGIAPGVTSNLKIAPTGHATFSRIPTSVLAFVEGSGNVAANLTVEGTMIVGYQLSVGAWGWGTMNIQNGGTVQTGILFFNNANLSHAAVNIINGTLQVDYQIMYGLSSFGGFVIDIKDGQMLVGDPAFTTAAAQAWIDLGFITGYGEKGNVKVEQTTVGGFPYVKLTTRCKMYAADGDIVRDCVINLLDLAKMSENWLNNGN